MSASMIRMCLVISTLATSPVLGACGHSGRSTEHAETLSTAADEVKAAVKDIVEARCDREQRCSHIAPGEKFDSRDMCESKLQGATADDLNSKDCPSGVDRSKLSTCLADIKAEDCGNPFDSLSRWNACRTGQICRK